MSLVKKLITDVLSIEVYQEHHDSIFTSNGVRYRLNVLFKIAATRPIVNFEVKNVQWLIDSDSQRNDSDWKPRVDNADLSAPILVWYTTQYGWVIVDGMHRCHKANQMKVSELPAIILSDSDMSKAIIR